MALIDEQESALDGGKAVKKFGQAPELESAGKRISPSGRP